MARIIDLVSVSIASEDSVIAVSDNESSKKITISDLRNTLVKRASSTVSGTIKVGTGLSIDGSGTLSVTNFSGYTLPKATTSTLGGVIVGPNLSISSQGVLSAVIPPEPKASTTVFGVVKVGAGLLVDNGTISNGLTLPPTFLVEGGQTISTNFTTDDDKKFYSISPITIGRTATFTLAKNSTWTIYDLENPSQSTEPQVIQESSNLITGDYTITNNRTATSYGPITIDRDVTVEIPPLSTWIIF